MDLKSSHVKEAMDYVEKIFQVIDRYEQSRPSSIAFTKLEEAILWLQVMVNQIPLKESEPKVVEGVLEKADAA